MVLRNISIKNYGPIDDLSYTFRFDETGKPIPLVLIGKNGCGKTLLFSAIIDMMVEAKRKLYPNGILEVVGTNYYKIGNSFSEIIMAYEVFSSETESLIQQVESLRAEYQRIKKTVDANGRRIFLAGEFSKITRITADEQYVCHHKIGSNPLEILDGSNDKKVYKISANDESNYALTKDDFVQHIIDNDPGFDKFSFDGFRPTLDTIKAIIQDAERMNTVS